MADRDLIRQLRLGEDSHLEFKSVRVARGGVRAPEDGSDPRVLDRVRIPVVKPLPEEWQTENWLLDDEYYWAKEGTWPRLDLSDLLDPVTPLWVDGFHTYHGHNDKIPHESMRGVLGSLRLIRAQRTRLAVFRPGEAFVNRLLEQFNLSPSGDLFQPREELLAHAIALQARRVAFISGSSDTNRRRRLR
ncbi:MAG: hypothetical protein OXJ90_07395 [Spirochaetaceae bacterium]|nr:hypothetical protein [Spirochaetaceae bacterium]